MLRLAAAVLRDQQRDRSRLRLLQRQFHLHLIRLHRLPIDLELLAVGILEHDTVDATDAAGLQMNGVLAAHDQRAVIVARQRPALRVGVHQLERRPRVFLEAPVALQRALDAVAEAGRGRGSPCRR